MPGTRSGRVNSFDQKMRQSCVGCEGWADRKYPWKSSKERGFLAAGFRFTKWLLSYQLTWLDGEIPIFQTFFNFHFDPCEDDLIWRAYFFKAETTNKKRYAGEVRFELLLGWMVQWDPTTWCFNRVELKPPSCVLQVGGQTMVGVLNFPKKWRDIKLADGKDGLC